MSVCDSALVSIVMPVYRAKNTISRAIDSIINQTYSNWELIIITEQDTDEDTLRAVRKYEELDDRIRHVAKREKRGVSTGGRL